MPNQDFSADFAIFRDHTESFFRRADAVRRLARAEGEEAHRTVVEALQDEEPYVRRAAAEGLTQTAQPGDLDAVLTAFDGDTDDQVKRALLKTLGAFADERALAKVKEMVENGSYSLRYDAQSVVSTIERKLAENAEAEKARAEEALVPPDTESSPEELTPLRESAPEREADLLVPPPPPEPPAEPEAETSEPEAPESPEPEDKPEPPAEPEEPEAPELPPSPTPPAEPEEPKEERTPSAGVLDFRSWVLAERLFWVPAALWPVLVLLSWLDGHGAKGWLVSVVVLLLMFWRRGVQFDGFSRSICRWSGVFIPLLKRYYEYDGLAGVEVREHASHWAEMLPEACRGYMRLELGRYDLVLVREKRGPIRLKRFRNLSAAMVAGQQTADFLALDLNVKQAKK